MIKFCSLVFSLALIAGCGTKEIEPPVSAHALMFSESRPSGEQSVAQDASYLKAPIESRSRMVIKSADVFIEVADLAEAMRHVQRITEQYSGFVVASSSRDENQKAGTLSLRIPSAKFDEALQKIRALASRVENENIRGNDVTEEFYDVAARLLNKEKAEKRLQEILKAAKNVREILEVEQSLTNTREEIERLTARKRYLADQVALCTINVNAHEPYPIVIAGKDGFWAKIVRGFHRGVEGFGDTMSAIVSFFIGGIPVFVMIAALLGIGYKLYKRRKIGATLGEG